MKTPLADRFPNAVNIKATRLDLQMELQSGFTSGAWFEPDKNPHWHQPAGKRICGKRFSNQPFFAAGAGIVHQPGVVCTAQVNLSIKSASGAYYTGISSYKFNSGGPVAQQIWPYPDTPIDEEQAFVLQLNGPASLASVQASLWCAVDGLGERVAVKLIDGKDRLALLKSLRLEAQAAKEPLSVVTLACNRRLTPAAKAKLALAARQRAGPPTRVQARCRCSKR